MAKEVIDIQKEQAAAASKAEEFLLKNKTIIWSVVCGVLVIAACIFGYNRWIYAPKAAAAAEKMYPSEEQFRAGNYAEAVAGFEEVIAEFGKKAGAAAYLYAGICNFNLKNYDAALEQFKAYSGKEPILAARAIACQGDCYAALQQYDKAVAMFKKAAEKSDNMYSAAYLKKAAAVYEVLGDKAEALKCYKAIKENYPTAYEAYDVDKYISRIAE